MPTELFVTCPRGLEDLLVKELQDLGAANPKVARSGVRTEGDAELAYKICLWSRIANRVLWPVHQFPCHDSDSLYQGMDEVDWSQHLDIDSTLAINYTATRSELSHTSFGARRAKDAIVDQFRRATGRRPSVAPERPDVPIHVHVDRDQATVSIDLAGDSLHRRGYRGSGLVAPLKENLAAAILMRAGWPRIAAEGGALIDPMCGSGTFLIEGALMASNTAPGLLRYYFGFQGWLQFDPELWERLVAEAKTTPPQPLPVIYGVDRETRGVTAAMEGIANAGLEGKITVERMPAHQLAIPADANPGLLICNPPYGERLATVDALRPVYKRLGETLRRHKGWQATVLTGNDELGHALEMRARKRHTIMNGAIECSLLHFDLGEAKPRPQDRPLSDEAQMMANRLRKNLKRLGKWAKRNNIECYRLYDADLPEYAFAIDCYADLVHVQEYAPPKTIDPMVAKRRRNEALAAVRQELGVGKEKVFIKTRQRQKGKSQYEKQDDAKQFVKVHEGGHRFWVNLADYLDTGLFLDHRPTRKLVQDLAKGRDCLNLFAYTASATVYAAKGGARSTLSIDNSNTYLDWAERNLELNDVRGPQHELRRADCLREMNELARRGRQFGLIFLDPPTFSNSKRMHETFDLQRSHVDLIQQAAHLLTDDGILLFSNNARRFKMDREALQHLNIEDITPKTIPEDFKRNPRIHNCWRISR